VTGIEARPVRKSRINWNDMGIILTLIAMIVFFSLSTKSFLSARNFTNIVRQISVVGICAVGMTMVILTGGIDLSIGSVIGLTSAIAAVMMSGGLPIWLSALTALALGVAIGFANATCINYLKIPPMITTLAMMISLRGAVYLITGGMPVYGIPEAFKVLGQGTIGIFPISSLIMIAVFAFGYVLLGRTPFGRRIYGIGGNVETARLSGVNVKKELYKMYMLVGLLGALAGLILTSRINSGQPSSGDGYEMDIITAVVLGGVSVSGGEGKLGKVIIGVVFMGVLANGMMMMNVSEYWQRVVKGLVLLVAVAVDIKAKSKGRAAA
jgi:ribose transport system permease protein/inositol transport system permease protein